MGHPIIGIQQKKIREERRYVQKEKDESIWWMMDSEIKVIRGCVSYSLSN
jgi:hypothetical protein